MEMSKFRIAVLVLLVATVIYAVALYQSVQAYNDYKQEKIENPIIEIYGNFKSFWDSSFGKPYFAFSTVLSLLWVFSIAGLLNKNSSLKNQIAVCLMVLTIMGVLCVLPEVSADETLHVDVLVATDEEFSESVWHNCYKMWLNAMLGAIQTHIGDNNILDIDRMSNILSITFLKFRQP